mmetsp:Transcript_25399/g.73094  ORF Transcript_25399/g.73094 Transcript_25399/m.73094 type:complete len:364 (-) Transcript_25399:386-1477(-)
MDHGKARSTRFKGQRHNGILDIQHFDRDTLIPHTKELNVIVQGLLRFGVSSDFDRQVVTIGMPHHIAFGNIEQVLLSQLVSGRDLNQVHVSWRVGLFGCPACENVCLRRPLEFVNTFHQERLLVEETHRRCSVDGHQVFTHTSQVVVIMRPLERRRRNILVHREALRIQGECTQELSTLNMVDLDRSFIVSSHVVGDQVVLFGTEEDRLDIGRHKSTRLFVIGPTPQNDTTGGHQGRQVASFGRPVAVIFTPGNTGFLFSRTIVINDRVVLGVEPVDFCFFSLTNNILISLRRIFQPGHCVGLFHKGSRFGLHKFRLFQILQFLGAWVGSDGKKVVLVKLVSIQSDNGMLGRFGRGIFGKAKA